MPWSYISLTSRFSGLMSRWTMFRLCRYLIALARLYSIPLASRSVYLFVEVMASKRSPPWEESSRHSNKWTDGPVKLPWIGTDIIKNMKNADSTFSFLGISLPLSSQRPRDFMVISLSIAKAIFSRAQRKKHGEDSCPPMCNCSLFMGPSQYGRTMRGLQGKGFVIPGCPCGVWYLPYANSQEKFKFIILPPQMRSR